MMQILTHKGSESAIEHRTCLIDAGESDGVRGAAVHMEINPPMAILAGR